MDLNTDRSNFQLLPLMKVHAEMIYPNGKINFQFPYYFIRITYLIFFSCLLI